MTEYIAKLVIAARCKHTGHKESVVRTDGWCPIFCQDTEQTACAVCGRLKWWHVEAENNAPGRIRRGTPTMESH